MGRGITISICFITALVTYGCKQEESNKKKSPSDLPATQTDDGGFGTQTASCVGYTETIQPIMQQYCISCHAPGQSASQWDLSNFATTAPLAPRIVARAVTQADMPPPNANANIPVNLPEPQKASLQAWANSGAKQSQAECPTTTGGTEPFNSSTSGTFTGTTGGSTGTPADPGENFGTEKDIAYAAELWRALRGVNAVGSGAVGGMPRDGAAPHGAVARVSDGKVSLDGHTARAYIKHNYGPAGITISQVMANPEQHLKAITVMFKREAGYDSAVKNFFFVKYRPDGSIEVNANDTPLAGRIGKGGNEGCVPCHSNASGGDYQYWND